MIFIVVCFKGGGRKKHHQICQVRVGDKIADFRKGKMPGNSWGLAAVQGWTVAWRRRDAAPSAAFKCDANSRRQPAGGQEMGDTGAFRLVEVNRGCSIMDDLQDIASK